MTTSHERKKSIIPQRKRFLIVCHGEKTEPQYFRQFKHHSVHVQYINADPKTLIQKAKRIRRLKEKQQGWEFDQCWCVFDKDDFSPQDFNEAVSSKKMRVAYSNEAIELWFLLHFDYICTGITRNQYKERLSQKFGKHYEKNDTNIYDYMKDKIDVAIRNATQLYDSYPQHTTPSDRNPCTTVHKLVEILRNN